MSLSVERTPETKGRRIRVELFESHEGVRCDCIGEGELVLLEGDTIQLSEVVSCDRCGGKARMFTLNVRLIEVVEEDQP